MNPRLTIDTRSKTLIRFLDGEQRSTRAKEKIYLQAWKVFPELIGAEGTAGTASGNSYCGSPQASTMNSVKVWKL